MMMLVQGSGSVQSMPVQDAQELQISALVEQQMQSVKRLVQMEGDLVAMRKQIASATGTEAADLQRNIRIAEGIVAGEKAKIADLKARISEVQSNAPSMPMIAMPPEPPRFMHDTSMFGLSKDEFVGIMIGFVTLPIVGAVTWRLLRRGPARKTNELPLQDDRLARLEQAVEAVAIEVERIGESQRFQAKLMTEKPQSRKEPVPRVITPV
jgi:hypothetical protein